MKKYLVLYILLVMIIGTSAIAFAESDSKTNSDSDMFKEAQAIREVLNENQGKENYQIAEVKGKAVYNDEFTLRYQKALASGSSTPYEDTVNSLAKIKLDYNFADEHGITVTNEDAIEYTNAQREVYENKVDPELKAGIKNFIEALGMTEDEYWENYKIKENTDYLTHRSVAYYQNKTGMVSQRVSASEFKIIDKNFEKANLDINLDIE